LINSAKVVYGILDQTISEDTKSYLFSSKTQFSKGDNILNIELKKKLTYLENNWLLLDGTREFPDTSKEYDVGWESDNLSDAYGLVNEYIEFDFTDKHDSYGIRITFGTVIKDFSVEYFSDTTSLGSVSISDNTDITYSDNNIRLQWNKIKITITKIAPINQRARLSSIIFGVSDTFESDDLVHIKAGKACSIKNDNTDSAEAEITFWNNGRFNIKTIKDLPVGLQAGLKATIYFDNALFNNYIVDSTEVNDEGKTITLSCYDEIYYLNDITFETGAVYSTGRSLYDWAKEVLPEIEVDDSFKNIRSKGYIGSVSKREALRMIGEAGNGIIKVENGTISLVPFAKIDGVSFTDDDVVEDTLSIQNEDKILGVKVKQYSFSKKSSEEGLAEVKDIALTGKAQTLSIDYSTTPANAETITTSSNITISKQVLGVDKADITFTGTAGETGWITILGHAYSVATAEVSSGYIDSHAKEIDNTLIADNDMAKSVMDFQLAHSASNYTYDFECLTDKNAVLLNKCQVKSYNIIVSNVSYEIDEDTNSLLISGEDDA
jgi:hypothetical protein